MDYTRKEVEGIRAAWSALEALCESAGGSAGYRLELARREEKPGRTRPSARALIVVCVEEGLQGLHRHGRSPLDFHRVAAYSPGLGVAVLLGVELRRIGDEGRRARFLELAPVAHAARLAAAAKWAGLLPR